MTAAELDDDVMAIALQIQRYKAKGGSLDRFGDVLPYALQMNELMSQGFRGQMAINFDPAAGPRNATLRQTVDDRELRSRFP